MQTKSHKKNIRLIWFCFFMMEENIFLYLPLQLLQFKGASTATTILRPFQGQHLLFWLCGGPLKAIGSGSAFEFAVHHFATVW